MNEEEKKALVEAEVKKATEALAAEKLALEEKLKGFENKDLNFANLRNKTAEEIKKAEEEKEKARLDAEALGKRVAEMEESIKKTAEERKERLISVYAGKDEEMKKKIEFHFNRIKGDGKSEAEIEAAIKDAYILATGGNADQDVLRGIQSASMGNRIAVKPTSGEVSPEAKEVAQKFNQYISNDKMKITEDDLKNPKYQVKKGQSAESSYKFN
jgi:hypothetical protein